MQRLKEGSNHSVLQHEQNRYDYLLFGIQLLSHLQNFGTKTN